MRTLTMLLSLVLGIAMGLATPVSAQDALGSGNVLDANLSTSGAQNVAAPRLNFQARNLLVTDNVVDGRGFRGTVGYTAARDFRGETGADEFDSFNQLSALSNPQIIVTGSTYTQLRYTQAVADLNYLRQYSSPGLDQYMESNAQSGDLRKTRMLVDRVTFAQTLAAQEQREAESRVIGTTMTSEGEPLVISTSELRGVSVTPPLPAIHQLGLSTYDLARLVADQQKGVDVSEVGKAYERSFSGLLVDSGRVDDLAVDQRVQDDPLKGRVEPAMAGDYTKVLQRIAERFAEVDDVDLQVERQLLNELDSEFDSLREQLSGEDEVPSDRVERPGLEQFERPSAPSAPTGIREPDEDAGEPGSGVGRSVEEFGVILRHGERVARLTSEDQSRFNEILAAAEQRLRAGEYFWAERRFEHALRFHPGHPLATAGLGHAQIGAGFYLPAALTLRKLLERQPEMIDVSFEEALLPNRATMNKAIETLQGRLEEPDRTKDDRASDAFVLAYLGHQLDAQDLVDHGLRVMRETTTGDALLPLLVEVWSKDRPLPEK